MTPPFTKKDYVCGIDISGTKEIRLKVYERQRNGDLTPVAQGPHITSQSSIGFENIIPDVSNLIRENVKDLPIKSLTIGLSIPARFKLSGKGEAPEYDTWETGRATIQQPVSGINLGRSCWEQDWAQAITERLNAGLTLDKNPDILIINDASIQFEALAARYKADMGKPLPSGKTLVVAPGTAFGAALADVDPNGSCKIRTNGHMYDAMVEITPAQEAQLRKLFSDYDIVEHPLAEFEAMTRDTVQPIGDIFPLTVGDKRQVHLIKNGSKTCIIPERCFAGRGGFQHLLGLSEKEIPFYSPAASPAIQTDKLKLIGELLGDYFIQFEQGTLKRLPLPESPPIPYDSYCFTDGRTVPLTSIMLGGGGLRGEVGKVIEEQVNATIKHHGSPALQQAFIYRPDSHQQTRGADEPHLDVCLAAAMRATALSSLGQALG